MKRAILTWTLITAAVALLVAGGVALYFAPTYHVHSLFLIGPPLQAGERVFMLTGQWKAVLTEDSERLTDLFVDLWAFDAGTVQPLWRKRLETIQQTGKVARTILGAEGETLWLLLGRGLVAVSMADGSVRTLPLQGLMPEERRYFAFDATGLRATTSDGRVWRFDPQSLTARPADTAGEPFRVIEPAYVGNSNHAFTARGLDIPGRWLGLLTDEEAAAFEKQNSIGDLAGESRRRLWGARTGEGKNFFGKFTTYREFTPLGNEFLDPALLSQHARTGRNRVIWLRDPDSVLVLHRDRLGEDGRLRLSRVAGPAGRMVWETPLPFGQLKFLMQTEDSLVLFGTEASKPAGGRLVSMTLATGTLHVYDQADVDHHPKPK